MQFVTLTSGSITHALVRGLLCSIADNSVTDNEPYGISNCISHHKRPFSITHSKSNCVAFDVANGKSDIGTNTRSN